jgi:hypothetical protein
LTEPGDSGATSQRTYLRNWISFIGIGVAILAFFNGVILFLLEIVSGSPPYSGILWVLNSGLLLIGFLLIPGGMLVERRRQKRGQAGSSLSEFRLDLSNPTQRFTTISLFLSFMLVFVLVGIGAFRAFTATESVGFCGELCHVVMNPEWVRYQDSAHARVPCAECHIGSGAGWFVKSKLSGLRQIWAVTFNTFSRPIPTPIHDLRPARETCEECHWRRKFTGYKELVRSYFLADEENTLHQLRMLVKIGGEKTTFLKGSGIHYHMLIANEVEYVAVDDKRQDIAWVRVKRADGSATEYNNEDFELTAEERAKLPARRMDCMDCHNRPAHQFPSPMMSVNESLEEGAIFRDLPFVKREAVKALEASYETTDEAMEGIANDLRYLTVFPTMKASWEAYPDNIGHRDSPGCFRCHTDSFVSDDGETIFTDCTRCHLILAQGDTIDQVNVNIREGLAFVHPEDYDTIEEYTICTDCHDGGAGIYDDE